MSSALNARHGLNPFPEGWFFVCYAKDLKPDKLITKHFMGTEIIAFRDEQGKAAVLDAICPHLGAHIGHGGKVVDGSAECPFHSFRFGADGKCNHVPGAEPPKRANMKSWPVQEVYGLVMAFHSVSGAQPTWEIPTLDLEGWSELATHHFRIVGHPQETTENSVDAAHLITIHGYDTVTETSPLTTDGPYMTGSYKMLRGSRGPFKKLGLEIDFRVDVWGLGYSLVDISNEKFGLNFRLLTLSTPSDGEHIDLHIALRTKIEPLSRFHPALQLAPMGLLTKIALEFGKRAYMHDIQQDFHIWQNKVYQPRPQLARNDGPVLQFRRYCRQFYPELNDQQPAKAAQ